MLREAPFKPGFVPLIAPNLRHPRKAVMVFAQQRFGRRSVEPAERLNAPPFSPFRVRTIGSVDQDSQEATVRINPELTLAPVDLFSRRRRARRPLPSFSPIASPRRGALSLPKG